MLVRNSVNYEANLYLFANLELDYFVQGVTGFAAPQHEVLFDDEVYTSLDLTWDSRTETVDFSSIDGPLERVRVFMSTPDRSGSDSLVQYPIELKLLLNGTPIKETVFLLGGHLIEWRVDILQGTSFNGFQITRQNSEVITEPLSITEVQFMKG